MRITEAFRRYGVELTNPQFTSSALSENPRELIVSLWAHNFSPDMSRYVSGTAHWKGAGKHIFRRHLQQAMEENLPIRVVVATSEDPGEVSAGNAARVSNDFEPDFSLVGRVMSLEANAFELAFQRGGAPPAEKLANTQQRLVKYWHVAEAVEALGRPSTTREIQAWLSEHYPNEDHSDVSYNLAHLTVNDANRRHYDRHRISWRTNAGHPRDRLYRQGKFRDVTYQPYRPSVHGHWDLKTNEEGVWGAVPLSVDDFTQAKDKAQDDAFESLPALNSESDAREWTMRAVAMRRGQSLFRARLLDAYGRQCAITGCSAVEVLEAAHVLPYRGKHTDRVDNGLLLRSDLHTLFDCLLLWITSEYTVALAPSLMITDYASLHGQSLRLPASTANHPNPAHLTEHANRCQERDDNAS